MIDRSLIITMNEQTACSHPHSSSWSIAMMIALRRRFSNNPWVPERQIENQSDMTFSLFHKKNPTVHFLM
jgi:hypothetical protein